jgi:hypothetical protein
MDFYPADVRRLGPPAGRRNVNRLPCSSRQIFGNHVGHRAIAHHASCIEENCAIGHFGNGCQIMAHEQYCLPLATGRFTHLAEAFLLKFSVADCQHFINY